jgi:hypothetical protein
MAHTERTQTIKHMRTKTILLAAAVFAAGLGTSLAQSPVYSVNAVGYVTKNLVPSYNLLANPLNGTNNNLNTIIPVCNEDSFILRWDPNLQTFSDPANYIGGAWDPNLTLNPGEGFFLFNAANATNITFVGEVPQGNLTNRISANYSLISHIVPQSIGLSAAGVSFPPAEDDFILFWLPALQTYSDPYNYIGGAWDPEPIPAVGEAFFYNTTAGARNWVRGFSVN